MSAEIEKDKQRVPAPVRKSKDNVELLIDAINVIILFTAGIGTRFFRIQFPDSVVFDEAHFGKFTNGYCCRHIRFFDIHPPLGKLILALTAFVTGYDGHQDFINVGERYRSDSYVYLRAVPAFFGALLIPLTYFTMRELRCGRVAAFVASLLMTLEVSLITESRHILTDSFLFFFCQLSIFLYVRLLNVEDGVHDPSSTAVAGESGASSCQSSTGCRTQYRRWLWTLFGCGIAFGCMLSVKWVAALATFGLCGLIEAYRTLRALFTRVNSLASFGTWVQNVAIKLVGLIVVPSIIYAATFWFHFYLLEFQGFGDLYLTNAFRNKSFFVQLFEENRVMYTSSRDLTVGHPNQSWWYEWPYMSRGIAYWGGGGGSRIHLLGNAPLWYMVIGAIVLGFLVCVLHLAGFTPSSTSNSPAPQDAATKNTQTRNFVFACFVGVGGWVMNLVPFVPVTRACFLYHYIPALMYGIMLIGVIADRFSQRLHWILSSIIIVAIVAVTGWGFYMFCPFAYGLQLTFEQQQERRWYSFFF